MTSDHSSTNSDLQQLRQLRPLLLRLHKALLDSEKVVYEQFHGRIQSPNEYFRLVTEHEWFNWLRPISQYIVQIDDVLKAKEPVSESEISEVLNRAKILLQPAEEGTTLERRYFRAIQRDPDIALMHAEMNQLLNQ